MQAEQLNQDEAGVEFYENEIVTFPLLAVEHDEDLVVLVTEDGDEMNLPVRTIRRFARSGDHLVLVTHREEMDDAFGVQNVIHLTDVQNEQNVSRIYTEFKNARNKARLSEKGA